MRPVYCCNVPAVSLGAPRTLSLLITAPTFECHDRFRLVLRRQRQAASVRVAPAPFFFFLCVLRMKHVFREQDGVLAGKRQRCGLVGARLFWANDCAHEPQQQSLRRAVARLFLSCQLYSSVKKQRVASATGFFRRWI